MKRYKYTFWNGMIEVPNGEYIKNKEADVYLQHWINKTTELENTLKDHQKEWIELNSEYSNERILSLLLIAGLLFSVFFNIFQFLIR